MFVWCSGHEGAIKGLECMTVGDKQDIQLISYSADCDGESRIVVVVFSCCCVQCACGVSRNEFVCSICTIQKR